MVHLSYEEPCGAPEKVDFTFDQLEARLVNAEALVKHRDKKLDEAAAGFTQALGLDPTWRLPAINLASAMNLKGNPDAAVAALAPWLTSEPVQTYLRIANDPELASLLAHPRLQAIAAKAAGTVKLGATTLEGDVAYSAALDAIAVTRTECSWGMSQCETDLELYDAKTGDQLIALPIVRMSDTDEDSGHVTAKARPEVEARAARLQVGLRGLGFAPAALEHGDERIETDDDGVMRKTRIVFPKAKLGLVLKDGGANLLRGNQSLATGQAMWSFADAVWVEPARVAVLRSGEPGSEGCEATDPTLVTVLPGR